MFKRQRQRDREKRCYSAARARSSHNATSSPGPSPSMLATLSVVLQRLPPSDASSAATHASASVIRLVSSCEKSSRELKMTSLRVPAVALSSVLIS